MLILTTKQLETQRIPYRGKTRLEIGGQTFHRGETFSKRVYAAAMTLCRESQSQGIDCLLVEHEDHVTIWREVDSPRKSVPVDTRLDSFIFNEPTTAKTENPKPLKWFAKQS